MQPDAAGAWGRGRAVRGDRRVRRRLRAGSRRGRRRSRSASRPGRHRPARGGRALARGGGLRWRWSPTRMSRSGGSRSRRPRLVRCRLDEPRHRHLATVHGGPACWRVRGRAARRPRDPRLRDEPRRARPRARRDHGYVACLGLLGIAAGRSRGDRRGLRRVPANLLGLVDAPAAGALPRRPDSHWPPPGPRVVVVAVRAGRPSIDARRGALLAPVVLPGAVAVAAFGIDAAWSARVGSSALTTLDRAAWAVEAVALIVLAAGSVAADRPGPTDTGRDRRASSSTSPAVPRRAGCRTGSASLLGDPGLVLAYPAGDGRLVDARGAPAPRWTVPVATSRRSSATGDVVAVIGHRAGLDQDADRMAAIATGAGLALDHERLLAESRARLADIRASRARVVEAGDRERAPPRARSPRRCTAAPRRPCPRVRVRGPPFRARAGRRSRTAPAAAAALADAETEVRAAIADVRDVAHGIYPAVAGRYRPRAGGRARLPRRRASPFVDRVDARRPSARPVEATAYLVIAEAPRSRGCPRARVRAARCRRPAPDAPRPRGVGAGPGRSHRARGPRRRARRVAAVDDRPGRRSSLEVSSRACRDRRRRAAAPRGPRAPPRRRGRRRRRHRRDAPRTCFAGSPSAPPDVALVDIRMPPTHTDEGLRRRRGDPRVHPEIGVLVLSHHVESAYAMRLLQDHPERHRLPAQGPRSRTSPSSPTRCSDWPRASPSSTRPSWPGCSAGHGTRTPWPTSPSASARCSR